MSSDASGDHAGLSRMLAEQRLDQALLRLGLSFNECAGMIAFDPEAETAYWSKNPQTGNESIHVGPEVANLDIDCLEMVLRHELLHRSMFHGFGERYANSQLANLTLDICINRLLFEAFPESMLKLSKAIYPEDSQETLIALANCAANPNRLPEPKWQQLWHHIWDRRPDGSFSQLNPASLYFRLLRFGSSKAPSSLNPFADPHNRQGSDQASAPKPIRDAIDAVSKDVNKHLPKGSPLGDHLSDFSISPTEIGTGPIEAFLRTLHVRKTVDQTVRKITEPLAKQIRMQPYPLFPTSRGLVYQICGLTDLFRMHWNRDTANMGARLAIGLYMDISASMQDKYSYICSFVEALKEYPLKLRVFDTAVRVIDTDDLARGRLRGGGGTDFDAPVQDFLDDPDLLAGLLFTDGFATLSPSLGRRLQSSRKALYGVYLLSEEDQPCESPLDAFAKDTTRIVLPNH